MANQTANALAGLGQSIGQGIQLYAENQRKSEAADATIASGIARFKSIADVYGQDPEFAPVVAQFAQRLEQYKDAPNQSYAKKAVMANEINMLGQDLAQTLQAQQVVRSRQIERVGSEILSQFPNVEKVTDPTFIKEGTSKFNTGKDYGANEGEFLTGLNKFRQAAKAAGKEIKGSDAEALDAYRRDVLDSTNKAMSAGTLDKAIGSRIIEQVEAQRSIEKKNAQAQSNMPVLPSMAKSSRKDYEAVTGTAYQAPEDTSIAARNFAPDWLTKAAGKQDLAKLQAEFGTRPIDKEAKLASMSYNLGSETIRKALDNLAAGKRVLWNDIIQELAYEDTTRQYRDNPQNTNTMGFSDATKALLLAGKKAGIQPSDVIDASKLNALIEQVSPSMEKLKSNVEELNKKALDSFNASVERLTKQSQGVPVKSAEPKPDMSKAPEVSLGKIPVGSVEYERKVNLAEKKAKVADLLTQRIGFTDPTTGKKTLPAGFDSWFKQMVPESDARVVDVDGVKLLWNGKGFEQVKMEQAKTPSPKEIGENSAFIFGVQTDKGIQPTELVPDSGVLIGGIVSGSTAGAEKVREQLTDLIDLRSSVSRLQQINDKFGEFANLRDQGISQYDLMKLRAVLTKQVNVSGSISDYERKEIAKMTPDPTAFLDFEPKTRAALLGIALGIDRDIKTLATSRGLSVVMQENGGMTQNQSLRQKFLSSK